MASEPDARSELYGRLTRGAPLAVLVAAALYGAYRLSSVLSLVAVAMLLAVVLRAAVHGLERLGLGPRLSVLAVILGFVGFGALVGFVVVPNAVAELRSLSFQLPRYVGELERFTERVGFLPDLSALTERLRDALSEVVGSLPTLVTGAAAFVGAVVVVLFLALYMSVSPGPLVSGALRAVPPRRRDGAREILGTVERRLRGWILGAMLVSLFIAFGSGIGLWAIGIPLFFTFGLIAGLLNVVPYLGSTIGAVLPTLAALSTDRPLLNALLVVALFLVLNQVEGYVLQPLVMGREVSLHPATVIVSFLVLGSFLGVLGALLAVPAAVVFTTLWDELLPEDPAPKE